MKNNIQILLIVLFSLAANSVFAQPANDLCGNATTITDLDSTCASYSNSGATNTNPYGIGCFSDDYYVWFNFTAQGPNAEITVSGVTNPQIAIVGLDQAGGTNLCDINDVLIYGCTNPGGNVTTATLDLNNNSLIPGEDYLIVVSSKFTGSGSGGGTFTMCVDNPVDVSPQTCGNAQPFCTGSPITFPAATDAGVANPTNDYGCLTTQPNPTWFFLEIDSPGTIDLEMASSPAEDIDFVSYGPFSDLTTACDNLTTTNILDCSFATATTETTTITSSTAGDVYVVMITNFSNNSTDITFTQTGGTGTTNCAVLPVQLTHFELYNENGENTLKWETGFESNNDYYTIERSRNGFDWKEVSTVEAGNTKSNNLYYEFKDADYKEGVNYYRLKQTDHNGQYEFLKIESINNEETTQAELIKKVNMLGQKVDDNYKGIVIEVYADGSTKRVMY